MHGINYFNKILNLFHNGKKQIQDISYVHHTLSLKIIRFLPIGLGALKVNFLRYNKLTMKMFEHSN